MARQAERKAAHRNAILDAAEQLLARAGHAATIEAIADHAGLAKGTLYNHFADKDALLRRVAQRVREAAALKVAQAIQGIEDAPGRLYAGIRVYLELVREEPDRGAILVQLIQDSIDPASPVNAALLAEIERGNTRGELNAKPVNAAVMMVLAVVQAAMNLAMGTAGRPPDPLGAEALVRFAIVGLSASPKPTDSGWRARQDSNLQPSA